MSSINRRGLLLTILLAANFAAGVAMADDGESDNDSDNSGSGSNNSGSGSGDSDDDGEDNGSDDDNDAESRSDSFDGGRNKDHERAIKAVKKGKAVSLAKLKNHLATVYPGKVLDIRLRKKSGDYFYNVRLLAKGNRIKQLSLNALTLKPRGN